ncbi:hypothetical protein [Streptomyces sp. NBC_00091]|uniref:hypothetical protein n=1 Tax=Streptomyces sp. NBC_00091 TaxID=2975648 RepID=UPI00224E02B2|nr:hypothetical protein [Streptomyces sp. NBC_00091]MCX5377605.1 hypothetical protein [Streptomyces sp. NBC_00091]
MPDPDGWEPLSEDARRCLEVLLAGDTDTHRGYRAQIPYALMHHGTCSCPCVYLRVDAQAVAAVPVERSPVVASGSLTTAEDVYVGDATLFAYDGYLADLQFCHWEDLGPLYRPVWPQLTAHAP